MEENNINKNIPTEILGVKLDEAAVKALVEGKETELIIGFVSQKTGRAFDAFLKMNSNGKVQFRFPEREKKEGAEIKAPKAPKVNKIPKTVGGVALDEEDLEDLKAGRETKLIMGIESKKKGKFYDAYLRFHAEKGILFRFPGMD